MSEEKDRERARAILDSLVTGGGAFFDADRARATNMDRIASALRAVREEASSAAWDAAPPVTTAPECDGSPGKPGLRYPCCDSPLPSNRFHFHERECPGCPACKPAREET